MRARRRLLLAMVWLLLAPWVASARPSASQTSVPQVSVPEPDLSLAEAAVAARIAQRQSAVLADPSSAQAWGQLGMAFDVHDFKSAAADCYRRALELDPDAFNYAYYLAIVLAGNGDEEAVTAFEKARSLRPKHSPLLVRYGDLLFDLGRLDDAGKAYRAAIEADGEGIAQALVGLARLALESGDLNLATARAESALADDPGLGPAHGLLAEIYRRQGEEAKAAEEREAFDESSSFPVLVDAEIAALMEEGVSSYWHHERGQFLLASRRPRQAEAEFRAALELSPHALFHQSLARSLLVQERFEEAESELRAALELAPDLAPSHRLLGQLLSSLGRHQEAILSLRRAAQLRPEAGVLRLLGQELLEAGDKPEGIHWLRQSLDHDEDPRTMLAVSWFLATTPDEALRDPKAAERYARRILELAGERPEPFDVLGAALAAQGDFPAAVLAAERALELARGSGTPLVRQMAQRLERYRNGQVFVANR